MQKSILLEMSDFHKELQAIFMTEKDPQLKLIACKALCNLSLDFGHQLVRDESFLSQLCELTYPAVDSEIKVVCCFTLKNLLFKSKPGVRDTVMKVLTYQHLLELLDDREPVDPLTKKVQEQALMMYRNLFCSGSYLDIQLVLTESGPELLEKLANILKNGSESLVVHTLYVLSSIASGNQKQKKIVMEDRFLGRALEMLR